MSRRISAFATASSAQSRNKYGDKSDYNKHKEYSMKKLLTFITIFNMFVGCKTNFYVMTGAVRPDQEEKLEKGRVGDLGVGES